MKKLSKIFSVSLLVLISIAVFAQKPFKESAVIPPGRKILVPPSFNHPGIVHGRLDVDIVINSKGEVVSARTNRMRTTIKDRHFIWLCEGEIKLMKFNPNMHVPERQSGSLTYWFK
jgi:hypothetical protein